MQKPELSNFLRRKAGLKFPLRPAIERHRRTLLLKHLDQPAGQQHQGGAGADLRAGGNKTFVIDVIARPIPADAGDGQSLHISGVFGVEEDLYILSPNFQGFFIERRYSHRESSSDSAMKRVEPVLILIGQSDSSARRAGAGGSPAARSGFPGWAEINQRCCAAQGSGSLSGMLKASPSGKIPRAWTTDTVPLRSASASSSSPTIP